MYLNEIKLELNTYLECVIVDDRCIPIYNNKPLFFKICKDLEFIKLYRQYYLYNCGLCLCSDNQSQSIIYKSINSYSYVEALISDNSDWVNTIISNIIEEQQYNNRRADLNINTYGNVEYDFNYHKQNDDQTDPDESLVEDHDDSLEDQLKDNDNSLEDQLNEIHNSDTEIQESPIDKFRDKQYEQEELQNIDREQDELLNIDRKEDKQEELQKLIINSSREEQQEEQHEEQELQEEEEEEQQEELQDDAYSEIVWMSTDYIKRTLLPNATIKINLNMAKIQCGNNLYIYNEIAVLKLTICENCVVCIDDLINNLIISECCVIDCIQKQFQGTTSIQCNEKIFNYRGIFFITDMLDIQLLAGELLVNGKVVGDIQNNIITVDINGSRCTGTFIVIGDQIMIKNGKINVIENLDCGIVNCNIEIIESSPIIPPHSTVKTNMKCVINNITYYIQSMEWYSGGLDTFICIINQDEFKYFGIMEQNSEVDELQTNFVCGYLSTNGGQTIQLVKYDVTLQELVFNDDDNINRVFINFFNSGQVDFNMLDNSVYDFEDENVVLNNIIVILRKIVSSERIRDNIYTITYSDTCVYTGCINTMLKKHGDGVIQFSFGSKIIGKWDNDIFQNGIICADDSKYLYIEKTSTLDIYIFVKVTVDVNGKYAIGLYGKIYYTFGSHAVILSSTYVNSYNDLYVYSARSGTNISKQQFTLCIETLEICIPDLYSIIETSESITQRKNYKYTFD